MALHSALSALFGLGFAVLVGIAWQLGSTRWLPWAALLYGGAVYGVDFQVLSRYVHHFSAFLQVTNQPFELNAHLVFGAVTAALLTPWLTRTRRPKVTASACSVRAALRTRGH